MQPVLGRGSVTATSHAGYVYYSGGATIAVNNTFKSSDPGPLNKYEYVSFTKVNI